MCGQTPVVLIRFNVERIGQYDSIDNGEAIQQFSSGEMTEMIEQRTLAGAVFHELLHALQYAMIYDGPIRYPASPFRTVPRPGMYQSLPLLSQQPVSVAKVIGAFHAIGQNHNVIRDAMGKLASEGLLEIPGDRSVALADYLNRLFPADLQFIIQKAPPGVPPP